MLKNIGNRNQNPREREKLHKSASAVEVSRKDDKETEELAKAKESIGAVQVSKDDNDLLPSPAQSQATLDAETHKDFNAHAFWKIDSGLDLEELMLEASL